MFFSLDWVAPMSEGDSFTGSRVVRHACRHRVTGTPPCGGAGEGVFGLGGLFHTLGAWERHRFNGGAVAVCFEGLLREHVLAGGPASQPQPPVERQHEGLGGLGDLIRCAGRAQERPFGAVTPLERRDEYYALFVFVGGAVAVCFEGLLREHVLAGGPASHACRRGSGSTRGLGFWFCGGALLPFGLRGFAGARA